MKLFVRIEDPTVGQRMLVLTDDLAAETRELISIDDVIAIALKASAQR